MPRSFWVARREAAIQALLRQAPGEPTLVAAEPAARRRVRADQEGPSWQGGDPGARAAQGSEADWVVSPRWPARLEQPATLLDWAEAPAAVVRLEEAAVRLG